MTTEEKRKGLERLLRACPDILTARMVARWIHQSKNTVYAQIKSGELPAFIYRGSYIVSKADLIDYMVAHTDDPSVHLYHIGGGKHGH